MISILICLYNEEENVRELTERIYNSVKIPFELIYVIDGNDKTYDIVKKMKVPNLKVDYSNQKRGYKNSFIEGFNLVNKKSYRIVTLDGDLNHQPEEITSLLEKKADIIIGSRYISKGKIEKLELWKRTISTFANLAIKIIWGIKTKDKTSGFRVYKKEKLKKILPLCTSSNFEFLFELLLLANKKKYSITEVPITFKARVKGKSKFQLLKVINGYLKLLIKYFPSRSR